MLKYFGLVILSLLISYFLTHIVKKLAIKFSITDKPNLSRKIQKAPVPLLGGIAIYLTFSITMTSMWLMGKLNDGILVTNQLLAILIGGLIIIIIGFLDDKYDIGPKSFSGPLIAALVAVALGIGINYVTNPFEAGTGPYNRSLLYFSSTIAPIFSFLWLLGMMYTTKFLDGLDGLVSGIGSIGAIILFTVSLFWDVPQSGTSILALILAGSCLGFLIHNWHPAKIFLGESGSVFIGFMLGVLSIISGGKIATALLIMGIPILDVAWVIIRRIIFEHKSPFSGDRKHLHFRLLDIGMSHRQVVIFLYLLTIIFGTSSLFLQSQNKVTALIILAIVMIVLAVTLVIAFKKKQHA